jgi:anti-anti-sigma factor
MNLDVTSEAGCVTRVSLSGSVSQPNLAPAEEPLGQLLGTDCYSGKVLLDMHDVETIDSSGVSWLLSCDKRFRTAGGRLVLHSLSPFARDVLKVLNLHLIMSIASDEQSAANLAQGTPS